jgi:hypothetical protein
MEENNGCVILKKKEYNDLMKKANCNKPDYINVELTLDDFDSPLIKVDSSIVLGERLVKQIKRITFLIVDKVDEEKSRIVRSHLSNMKYRMSKKQRRKIFKNI